MSNIKLASRRYAKRQLTWFRHESDAKVIYADRPDGKIKSADDMLDEALALAEEMMREFKSMKGDE